MGIFASKQKRTNEQNTSSNSKIEIDIKSQLYLQFLQTYALRSSIKKIKAMKKIIILLYLFESYNPDFIFSNQDNFLQTDEEKSLINDLSNVFNNHTNSLENVMKIYDLSTFESLKGSVDQQNKKLQTNFNINITKFETILNIRVSDVCRRINYPNPNNSSVTFGTLYNQSVGGKKSAQKNKTKNIK